MTPTTPQAEKHWLETAAGVAGVAGLYLFAFFAWVGLAGGFISLGLMLLALLLVLPRVWPALIHDKVFLLFAAFSVYLLIRAGQAHAEFPDADQFRLAFDWMYLGAFVVVAWWLVASERRMAAVLALALFGLLVGVVRSRAWSEAVTLLAGERSGFGRGIPQMGLFSAVAALSLVVLAPRIWGPVRGRPFWLRVTAWAVALVALVEVLILSQSRISWAAVLLVLPVLLVLQARGRVRPHPGAGRPALLVGVGVLLLAALVLVNFGIIKQRSLFELDTMEAIAEGQANRVPMVSPVGARFHLFGLSVSEWMERPLFGWGPGTQVARLAPGPLKDFGHVHNTYLEMLARFGLFGVLLVGAGLWLNLRSLVHAYREGRIALDYLLAILSGFAVLAIWCSANFRLSSDWRFFWILLNALPYTFRLHGVSATAQAAADAGVGADGVRAAPLR